MRCLRYVEFGSAFPRLLFGMEESCGYDGHASLCFLHEANSEAGSFPECRCELTDTSTHTMADTPSRRDPHGNALTNLIQVPSSWAATQDMGLQVERARMQ